MPVHPLLFDIGGLKVHSYGLMVAVGFLAALGWVRYQAPKEGLPAAAMIDLAFWLMLAAIVGSRLAFIAVEWEVYARNPAAIFKIWEGGLVFYGGLIACIFTAWFYLKRRAWSFWKVADVFMPGVALGHAFGRIGCFLAGCCYGRGCDPKAWYAAHYPGHAESLAPSGIPLYPVQLFEAGANLAIFAFLAYYSRKKAFDGQILLLYLITYALSRIVLELFRGDAERGYVIQGWLSTSQFLGAILLLAALAVLLLRRGRSS
ncbi:MAG TPA: prolipoprotein diacylglyceryl transferase [bacterium]|nr:prolipoprotein diacylglyceryl transferase [bacterium]